MRNEFDFLERTELIIGQDGINKLNASKVLVFGAGGVGGYTIESLVRGGIGTIGVVDFDVVNLSNLNRQIIATTNSIGKRKIDAVEERVQSINPYCKINKYFLFCDASTIDKIDIENYDYVCDCIDTISAKILIVKKAEQCGVPVISCMATGNKLNASLLKFADINQTKVCPLAKIMRKLCKQNGINALKVLYSQEKPVCVSKHQIGNETMLNQKEIAGTKNLYLNTIQQISTNLQQNQQISTDCTQNQIDSIRTQQTIEENCCQKEIGSVSFVPSVAGLLIGGEVIKSIINFWGNGEDKS